MTSVVTSLLSRRNELAGQLASHLRANVGRYGEDPVLAGDVLTDAAEAYLSAVLGRFTSDRPFDTTYARRAGRERARAGIPLSTVMEAYRIGISHIWEIVADAAQVAHVPPEDLISVTASLWQGQDLFTSAMAEGYREERTSILLRQQEERAALVEALLTGRVLPQATLWEIADVLRLPSDGPFVVVAAALEQIGRQWGSPVVCRTVGLRDAF